MSVKDVYDPSRAVADPKAFYDDAFENQPKSWVVPLVGKLAVAWALPTITFYDTNDETEYWDEIGDGQKLLTFSHYGEKKYHDPSIAAAVVFKSRRLLDKVDNLRVWAAAPYLTHRVLGPVIEGVGGVPVIRSGDYKHYNVQPTDEESKQVTDTLISKSIDHLKNPDSTLVIFPAGTKGASKVRDGVGLVLEQVVDATVIPIAMVSDSLDKNHPKNSRAMFGEPIRTEMHMMASDYVKNIDENLSVAADNIR